MNQSLRWLNHATIEQAEEELLKCCGCHRWASEMVAARPFENEEELFATADRIWSSLSSHDWLEAFRAHPKIGENKAEAAQSAQAQKWSSQEQAGTASAQPATIAALAAGNREYEQRFGFIFIICASGKSSDEMLSELNERLENDRETEIRAAAEEQRKITHLRLEKLLNQ